MRNGGVKIAWKECRLACLLLEGEEVDVAGGVQPRPTPFLNTPCAQHRHVYLPNTRTTTCPLHYIRAPQPVHEYRGSKHDGKSGRGEGTYGQPPGGLPWGWVCVGLLASVLGISMQPEA